MPEQDHLLPSHIDIYLVGGAVRDSLLGIEQHDRDWVVVGASIDDMEQAGFMAVGKDFPVFLHPQTKEEYALARTERKAGVGYKGFQVYAAKDVTIEQDLLRRDLTINAMALDMAGNLIDPYQGKQDLDNRLLRQVSHAFAEDPLRVIRAARFHSKLADYGFRPSSELMAQMRNVVLSDELNTLAAERIWQEIEKVLQTPQPRHFFETLRACGALAQLLPEIDNLYGIEQPPIHHPEICCGLHTMLTLEQACILSDNSLVRFAALVHDLGKATTPKEILPSHHGHEQRGVGIIKKLCQRLRIPNQYRKLAMPSSEYHLHCHRAFELKPSTILKLLKGTDALRNTQQFFNFLLVCEADARGRTGLENRPYPQPEYLKACCNAANSIDISELRIRYEGQALGDAITQQQIKLIAAVDRTDYQQ